MASSRKDILRLPRAALVMLACLMLLALAPTAAFADEPRTVSVEGVEAAALGQSWQMDADAESGAAVARLTPMQLNALCDPASIEVGVDCGMDWMCGIKPCLCGSADQWGGCSCNGLTDEVPTVAWQSSDEGVVRVVEAFDRTWLVPVGAGKATLTATPSLSYHEGVPASVQVTVEGLQVADFALIALIAGMIAAVCAACFGVRRIVSKRKG